MPCMPCACLAALHKPAKGTSRGDRWGATLQWHVPSSLVVTCRSRGGVRWKLRGHELEPVTVYYHASR